jgi:hypothetical protein
LATGVLSSPGARELAVTKDDALWLARAVEAEGEPRRLVAQTLVNRWAWLADFAPGKYPSLASLVRAYAQPVNPRWFEGGDLYEAHYAQAQQGDPDATPPKPPATPAQLAALRKKAQLRRDVHSVARSFSKATQDAVAQALRGPLVIPPGAVDYAIPGRPFPVLVPAGPKQNAIYGDPAGRATNALYSFLVPGPSLSLGRILDTHGAHAVIAVILMGLGAGFAFSRKGKRR